MAIGKLQFNSRGFDCNTKVSATVAALFRARGYRFAIRYVGRNELAPHDISTVEAVTIRRAGLALMLVQHVARPGWLPTGALGVTYGSNAVEQAHSVGYPDGATLWCDLEGVFNGAPAAQVIDYCRAWHQVAYAGGYEPGLYVGDSCGLTADELYYRLPFKRYWSAYNLNRENYPAVRGVQMRQKPYPQPAARVAGVPFEYDEDVILLDNFFGTPTVWLPDASTITS